MNKIGKTISRWAETRHYYIEREAKELVEAWQQRIAAERKQDRRGWYRVSDGQAMLEFHDAFVRILPAVTQLYDALVEAQQRIEVRDICLAHLMAGSPQKADKALRQMAQEEPAA